MLLVNLARELFETWRLPEAADYAERAYAKAQRAGDEIVVGQALSVRTHIHRDRGQLEQCEAVLTELAAHWQRILPSGHGAFASLASHYAKLALARGDIPAALAASDQAITLATASGAGRDALPMFLIPRAGIELRAGRLEEALTTVIKAIALEETIAGSEAQSCWVGRAQLTKGRILAAQGQRELARTAFALAREHLQLTVGADHPETREAIQGAAAQ